MSAIQMAVLLMVNGGATPFNFTPTISADTLNYNLRAAAVAAGWNQADPLNATVTINPGVYVGSSTTSGYGFDTGVTFPAGTTLAVINNGFIVGCGGNGGDSLNGVAAGSPGGPAFRAQAAVTVTNNGTIGGGGGGGGGGGRGLVYSGVIVVRGGGGGGGGCGLNGGAGGAGGNGGGNGTAGSKTAAGAGGNGASPAGAGGNGGGLGSAGSPGSPGKDLEGGSIAGGAGGAAGAAVVGNSNITWAATGTRLGAIT